MQFAKKRKRTQTIRRQAAEITKNQQNYYFKSSRPEVFCKESCSEKNFAKFTRKTCPGVLWACRVIKKETPVFPVNFQKCFRTAFYGTREDDISKPYIKTKVSVSLYYYFMENCQPFLPQHL